MQLFVQIVVINSSVRHVEIHDHRNILSVKEKQRYMMTGVVANCQLEGAT